jgi:hypothetical protein
VTYSGSIRVAVRHTALDMIRHGGGPRISAASISDTTFGRGSSCITGHNRPDDGDHAANRNHWPPDHAARGVIDETVGGLMSTDKQRPAPPATTGATK